MVSRKVVKLVWLARFLLRRRVAVLGATLAVVALAGAFGAGAVGKLKSGGFEDPASESSRAAAALRDTFHTGDPNLVVLVTAHNGSRRRFGGGRGSRAHPAAGG
jgi:putative drug exporter of the RND superfamily